MRLHCDVSEFFILLTGKSVNKKTSPRSDRPVIAKPELIYFFCETAAKPAFIYFSFEKGKKEEKMRKKDYFRDNLFLYEILTSW